MTANSSIKLLARQNYAQCTLTQMEPNTGESGVKQQTRDMVVVSLSTKVVISMKDSLWTSTKDSGKMIRSTDKEFLNGVMAVCIRESTRMMSSMGMECLHGQMTIIMMENGWMVNNMAKGYSHTKTERSKEVCGLTASVQSGSEAFSTLWDLTCSMLTFWNT